MIISNKFLPIHTTVINGIRHTLRHQQFWDPPTWWLHNRPSCVDSYHHDKELSVSIFSPSRQLSRVIWSFLLFDYFIQSHVSILIASVPKPLLTGRNLVPNRISNVLLHLRHQLSSSHRFPPIRLSETTIALLGLIILRSPAAISTADDVPCDAMRLRRGNGALHFVP